MADMQQEYREFSEKSVEDAITAACQALMVTSDKLEYVVADEGSQGFLGLGARNAVIRARVKSEQDDFAKEAESVKEVLTGDETFAAPEKKEEVKESAEEKKPRRRRSKGKKQTEEGGENTGEEAQSTEPKKSRKREEKPLTAEQVMEVKERADAFLTQVFQAMGMDVDIDLKYDEAAHILTTSFNGDDMGVLIGKRGQTLDSLQYLVSLVVNKGLDSYVHVKADTENYRERRKKTLENLAKNISSRVKRTGHAVSLEPMNPYERRIIHSALQGDKFCTTYSEGEEPFRRVVVTLKKGKHDE